MAKGNLSEAATRRIIAGAFGFVGTFVLLFGVGSGNVLFILLGGLIIALALVARVRSSLRPRTRQWVPGIGRITTVADQPPPTGEYGRCELQLAIDAPGVPAETVLVRDPRVPVDEWPVPGLEVPIEVAADNTRNVRILWRGNLPESPSWTGAPAWVEGESSPTAQPAPPPTPYPTPPPDPVVDDFIDFDLDETGQFRDNPAEGSELSDQDEFDESRPTQAVPAPPLPAPRTRPPAEVDPPTGLKLPPAVHGIGLTLLVSDLANSVAFYRDRLGFHEVDNGDGTSVLASGGTRLLLRSAPNLDKVKRRLTHLNLEVGDIDGEYARLRDSGLKFTYPPRVVNRGAQLELWAAAFQDPDGHGVALTQWRSPQPSQQLTGVGDGED